MIKAVSALRLAVADPARSVAFYKKLGFTEIPGEGDEVRSNWFRIRFESRASARSGDGLRICVSVDDVEAYAAHLKGRGIPVSREAAGKREELVVSDPDGYPVLFFATKGAAQKGEASHRPAS